MTASPTVVAVRSYSRYSAYLVREGARRRPGTRSRRSRRRARSCAGWAYAWRKQTAIGLDALVEQLAHGSAHLVLVERREHASRLRRRAPSPPSAESAGRAEPAGPSGAVHRPGTRPISSTSRKPRVVIRPALAPLCSSIVLRPSVVPWKNVSIADTGIRASASACSTAAPGRPGTLGTFADRKPATVEVERDQIGEGAADVDGDAKAHSRPPTGRRPASPASSRARSAAVAPWSISNEPASSATPYSSAAAARET